jgi:hypothetical protein
MRSFHNQLSGHIHTCYTIYSQLATQSLSYTRDHRGLCRSEYGMSAKIRGRQHYTTKRQKSCTQLCIQLCLKIRTLGIRGGKIQTLFFCWGVVKFNISYGDATGPLPRQPLPRAGGLPQYYTIALGVLRMSQLKWQSSCADRFSWGCQSGRSTPNGFDCTPLRRWSSAIKSVGSAARNIVRIWLF